MFVFSNLFYLPALFTLLSRIEGRPFLGGVMILQFASLAFLLSHSDILIIDSFKDGICVAILFALVSEPFWMAYHGLMLRLTTDEDRGHQVSMAELGMRIGGIIGSLGAGLALSFFPGQIFPLFCGATLLLSTAGFFLLLLSRAPDERMRISFLSLFVHIIRNPMISMCTLVQGMMSALTGVLAPVWMSVIGFSGILAGLLMALQIVARLVAGPLAGQWFHDDKGRELRVGALAHAAGWLSWIITSNPLAMIWSAFFWSAGSHMVNIGMDGRWYKSKSLANMASREICLGIGRLSLLPIILILFTVSIKLFFVFAAITSILLYVLCCLWQKQETKLNI